MQKPTRRRAWYVPPLFLPDRPFDAGCKLRNWQDDTGCDVSNCANAIAVSAIWFLPSRLNPCRFASVERSLQAGRQNRSPLLSATTINVGRRNNKTVVTPYRFQACSRCCSAAYLLCLSARTVIKRRLPHSDFSQNDNCGHGWRGEVGTQP
jgi:hypothetical protein